MKVFGCQAYAHIPRQERKKLDAKSKEWIFVGYSQNPTAYRLRDPSNPKKLIESRDVIFLEDSFSNTDSTDKLIKSEIPLNQLLSTSPIEETIQEELDLEDEENDSYHSVSSDTLQEEQSQDENMDN